MTSNQSAPRKFSRQDLYTFLLGLGAAVVVPVAHALIELELDPIEDWGTWASGVATGVLAAAGRYILTRVTQPPAAGGNVMGQAVLEIVTDTTRADASLSTLAQRVDLDEVDLLRTLRPEESTSAIKPMSGAAIERRDYAS